MKGFFLGAAAGAAMLSAGVAFAQVAPPPGVAQGTAPVVVPRTAVPQTHMMVMSNRTMTRDGVVEHIRKFFARLDTNRDGFVTREELNSVHDRMMGVRADIEKKLEDRGMLRPNRAAMFDRLDTNHDGMISRQEYMARQPQVSEERVFVVHRGQGGGGRGMMRMHGMGMGMGFGGHLFDMADANHDGRVSLQEAESAALAHFDRADLNHDGKLTPEERRQAHQLMRSQHRPS